MMQDSWFISKADTMLDAETAQQILETLPDLEREVVMLRIWGQMTLKETAAIIGCSLSTVHSRYQTALAHIKRKMETVINEEQANQVS